MVYFNWLWYLLCAMQYSYLIMQYFWVSLATRSLRGKEAERIWLITQDLICSKWGEHVTEPVVNKSSHLLPLIITVITLIIFNSAPLIRASLGVQSFMNAMFTGYNGAIQNDTLSCNYELCSGVGSSWQRKSELYWKRRIIFSLRVLGTCFWLAALFFCGIVHLPVNHGTQDRWWSGQKEPRMGWLIPAESGLHPAVSPSANCWWFIVKLLLTPGGISTPGDLKYPGSVQYTMEEATRTLISLCFTD